MLDSTSQSPRGSLAQTRAYLSARLQARRGEIEQRLLTRVYAVSDPKGTTDSEYLEGLRTAVSAGIDYGLAAIERGEGRAPPVPTALLAQARLAARSGISLDIVLRRYLAGHTLLDHFLTEEIEGGGPLLAGTSLKSLLGSQAALLDQLLAAVSKEYDVETRSRLDTSDRRRAERVGRLLNGELVDTSELAYDFEISHLGVIATGPGAAKAIRGLASASDCGLLLVPRGEQTVWAWLGTRRPIDPDHVERHISSDWPAQLTLALGEPAKGFTGWRRTHMQAKASLSIALRSPLGYARYGDVPLLASAFQDDLLAASLHELYLVPLELEPNGGRTSLETLRAYIAAGRKVSPAAAALGLNRRTVAYRLHAIETRLGRPLGSFMAEIEVALKLQDLSDIPSSPGRTSQSN